MEKRGNDSIHFIQHILTLILAQITPSQARIFRITDGKKEVNENVSSLPYDWANIVAVFTVGKGW